MATVTINHTVDSPTGTKLLFASIAGTDNYAITGDPIRAGTEVNVINAIITIIPSGANGYFPEWSNAQNVMFYKVASNVIGVTGNIPMGQAQASTNFAKVSFPALIVGKAK